LISEFTVWYKMNHSFGCWKHSLVGVIDVSIWGPIPSNCGHTHIHIDRKRDGNLNLHAHGFIDWVRIQLWPSSTNGINFWRNLLIHFLKQREKQGYKTHLIYWVLLRRWRLRMAVPGQSRQKVKLVWWHKPIISIMQEAKVVGLWFHTALHK
jgi:hypothetical protein